MKAVVMAGGEGSRLRPLTLARPKPMLPIVNRPVLGHILHLLKRHGITRVILTLQYMAGEIQDYYGDGQGLEMDIEYVIEESPLGSAGGVRNALPYLTPNEAFLVISGDALTDLDLTALANYHRARKAMVTVTLCQVPDPLEYGVVNVHDDGRIAQFLEKPSWREVTSDTVNAGIYMVEPEVLERIPGDRPVDWSQHIFPEMLAAGEPVYGYIAKGYWCDIGTLGEYRRANADLLSGVLNLGDLGRRVASGIWSSGSVKIAPDAHLFGPIYLGDEVEIKSGVVVNGPAVIRDYTVVESHARVDHSIIWRNCYIGERVELHGAVIGSQCSLKAGAAVFEGAVIGDRTIVGEGAVIQSGVKIWPSKEVERDARVTRSLIWGSQGRRALFGRYGITGIINVDLTPDFVARVGAAFGSILPKGSAVTISRDPHRIPRMIKRAVISGIPSSGNNVLDLRTVPIPVTRYYTRAVKAAGGVHVRLSPFDQRVVDIRFFGPDGLNITRDEERAIERIFFREDFRRAYMEEIGNIEYVPDAADVYARGYMQALDVKTIEKAHLKIVVDYAHSPATDVLPQLLEQLHVDVVPLNARVDPNKISISQDEFRAGLSQLSRITGVLNGIYFGVRLDVGGEKIYVVDESGVNIPTQVMSAAMAALVFQVHRGARIVVTVDQSSVFERLAERYGGQVQRCPVAPQALMQAAAQGDVTMACDGGGSFIFSALHPANDGLMAIGKLIELLAYQQHKLSDVIANLPPFFVASGEVVGSRELKGRVMRCLMQEFCKLPHDKLDGVKVHLDNDAWVLIRPDEEGATFHLTAEATSMTEAERILAEHESVVRSILQSPCTGMPETAGTT